MELTSRMNGNVKILTLSGSFDTFTSGWTRKWMEEATKNPPVYLVINLAEVQFLDSTALSTLVQGMKRAREHRGDVRLCGLQQPVRMIFELTRLDRVFEIYPTEEGAVQAFQ